MNLKFLLAATAVFAFLGVALGAFGAHSLKNVLGDYGKEIWHKAVFYHLIHAVAMLFVILIRLQKPEINFNPVWYAFLIGILLFSGSLYILAVTQVRIFGAITPLGGVSFLFGWGWLIYAALKMG